METQALYYTVRDGHKAKSICLEAMLIAMETGWWILSESHSTWQKTSINNTNLVLVNATHTIHSKYTFCVMSVYFTISTG